MAESGSETLEQNRRRGMEAMASSGNKVRSKIQSKKKRQREESLSRSSSPPLSVKHERSVYVRVLNAHDQLEWCSFVFNRSGEDDKRKISLRDSGDHIPVITPFSAKKISPFSRCALVDSTMYCVGAKSSPDRFSRRLRQLDTRLPKHSWKKAPSMLTARCNPQVVALNGKIYVIGGTEDCDSEPWAEVFNPKSNSWVSLASPSPKPTECDLFSAALHDHDKVVVGSTQDDFLYTYNVGEECWEMLDFELDYRPSHLQPVAVDNTLFWFQDSALHAYDVLRKSYSSGFIAGLEKVLSLQKADYTDSTPVMLHVAGSQFILICLEDLETKQHVTVLHCIKFCVSRCTVQGHKVPLSAVVQSSETFIINRQLLFVDEVLMDTRDSSSVEA